MKERKVAIQAMRKITYRDRSVLLEDAINDQDKAALVNLGLCEWHIGTDVDGEPSPYLMFTEAGIIAHEFAFSEKRWRRKWEIVSERASKVSGGYKELLARYRSGDLKENSHQ